MVKPEVREEWSPLRAGSPHLYRFEAPDLFFSRTQGDVSGADLARMFDLVEEFAARAGRRLFWMADISRVGKLSEEVGKLALARDLKPFLRGALIYGGSFHQRLLATMVTKALHVLKPERRTDRVVFCATEAEARAVVEEQRRLQNAAS
ncbi:hypothetical protein [Polyangium mundeleinium]|uniref:STAS domain-containing protein n=1 Tax=Polyangium mundeleinium TaxID=2995306 RepID=A0ABT5EDT1_9BACT|nr:hypothetical protein [Polyangium mundeleinium]MDC0739966.1 hypothetical protein [Polyangium mundeleinium]